MVRLIVCPVAVMARRSAVSIPKMVRLIVTPEERKEENLTRFNSKDGAIDSLSTQLIRFQLTSFNSKDGAIDRLVRLSNRKQYTSFNSKDGAIDSVQLFQMLFYLLRFNSKDGAIDSDQGGKIQHWPEVSIPKMVRLIDHRQRQAHTKS